MNNIKRSVAVKSQSTSAAQLRRNALAISVGAAFALPQIAYAQATLPQGWQPTSGTTAPLVYRKEASCCNWSVAVRNRRRAQRYGSSST